MYQSHFQLHDRPFASVANPDHYYPAASIEQAREVIALNLERASGATTLIGAVGSGKTLLCQLIANQFSGSLPVSMVSGSELRSAEDLLHAILHELDLPHHAQDQSELRRTLSNHVMGQSCMKGIVLVIDEADRLPIALLEEVRALTNLAKDGQPCIRLLLAGLEPLEETLGSAQLESLNQRIVGRLFLENFTQDETRDYIRARIQAVGGDADSVFTEEAIQNVYRATYGVPRLVNQISDHALLMAAVANASQLDGSLVEEAWADLQQIPVPSSAAMTNASSHDSAEVVIEFGSLDEDDASPIDQSGAEAIVVEFGDDDVDEAPEQVEVQFGDSIESETSGEIEITIDDEIEHEDLIQEVTVEEHNVGDVGSEDPLVEVVIGEFDEPEAQPGSLIEEVVIEEDFEIEIQDDAADIAAEVTSETADQLAPTIEDDIEEEDEIELPETDELTTEMLAGDSNPEAIVAQIEDGLTIDQATNPFGAQFGGTNSDQPREVESYLEGANFPSSGTGKPELAVEATENPTLNEAADESLDASSSSDQTIPAEDDVATTEACSSQRNADDETNSADVEVVVEEFTSAGTLARDGASEVSTSYSSQLRDRLTSAQPELKMHWDDSETGDDVEAEQLEENDELVGNSEQAIDAEVQSETGCELAADDVLVTGDEDAEFAEESAEATSDEAACDDAACDDAASIETLASDSEFGDDLEEPLSAAIEDEEVRDTDRLASDLDDIEQELTELKNEFDGKIESPECSSEYSDPLAIHDSDTADESEIAGESDIADESCDSDEFCAADDIIHADDIAAEEDGDWSDDREVAATIETSTHSIESSGETLAEGDGFDPSDDPVLPEDGVEAIVSGLASSVSQSIASSSSVESTEVNDVSPDASPSSERSLEVASESSWKMRVSDGTSSMLSGGADVAVETEIVQTAETEIAQTAEAEAWLEAEVVTSPTIARDETDVSEAKQQKVFSTLFSKMRRD